MCAPFIFIATNRLREGKLAAERDRAADLGSFIENTEPQLLAFNEYVNEDGTEVGSFRFILAPPRWSFTWASSRSERHARMRRRSRRQPAFRFTASRAMRCWRCAGARPAPAFR